VHFISRLNIVHFVVFFPVVSYLLHAWAPLVSSAAFCGLRTNSFFSSSWYLRTRTAVKGPLTTTGTAPSWNVDSYFHRKSTAGGVVVVVNYNPILRENSNAIQQKVHAKKKSWDLSSLCAKCDLLCQWWWWWWSTAAAAVVRLGSLVSRLGNRQSWGIARGSRHSNSPIVGEPAAPLTLYVSAPTNTTQHSTTQHNAAGSSTLIYKWTIRPSSERAYYAGQRY